MTTNFTTEPLVKYQDRVLDFDSLCQALSSIGVTAGDDICVHSNLFRLGRLLVPSEVLFGTIVAALREVIGEKGTLLMPTFSYSYCDNQVFDVRNTPSHTGVLTEYYRKLPECHRTLNPIFSFAISGVNTQLYLQCNNDTCFNKGTIYELLTQMHGKIVILGDIIFGHTFMHLIEEYLQVSFRYHKVFSGSLIDEQGVKHDTSIDYYVRHLDRKSIISGYKVVQFLLQTQIGKTAQMCKDQMLSYECVKAAAAFKEQLLKNEEFFLLD